MKLSVRRRVGAILWAILSAVSLGWAQHSSSGAEVRMNCGSEVRAETADIYVITKPERERCNCEEQNEGAVLLM